MMIRCHHCGTDNLDQSEYCDECGNRLGPSASARSPQYVPPQPPPPPPTFTREPGTPKPATPYTPPPPPPPVRRSGQFRPPAEAGNVPGNSTSAIRSSTTPLSGPEPVAAEDGEVGGAAMRAKLVIQRGGKIGKEFTLSGTESLIGRWDADGGIFPDVDLDQDDPEAKVSRRHARIQCQQNQYLIEDLGSTNGTFVNRGPRLLPGNKQPLKNGDEIIVGKTFLKFVLS
jgi:hypothetical protein